MPPDGMYSEVFRRHDIAAILQMLEQARPDLTEAVDLIRTALHIETSDEIAPKPIWRLLPQAERMAQLEARKRTEP